MTAFGVPITDTRWRPMAAEIGKRSNGSVAPLTWIRTTAMNDSYSSVAKKEVTLKMTLTLLMLLSISVVETAVAMKTEISNRQRPADDAVINDDVSLLEKTPTNSMVVVLEAFNRNENLSHENIADSGQTPVGWNSDAVFSADTGDKSANQLFGESDERQRVTIDSRQSPLRETGRSSTSSSSLRSGDCHQLDISQATAAVLQSAHSSRTHHLDGRADAQIDRKLLDELRRRFSGNRTIVLCKSQQRQVNVAGKLRSMSENSQQQLRQAGGNVVDRKSGSRHRQSSSKSDSNHDVRHQQLTAPVNIRLLSPEQTARNRKLKTDSVGEQVENSDDERILSERASLFIKDKPEINWKTDNSELPTAITHGTADNYVGQSFPFPFPGHRLRHSGRRSRRHNEHIRRQHSRRENHGDSSSRNRNDSNTKKYFLCNGRRFSASLSYFRRLEFTMRARDCWNDEDEQLIFEISRWSSASEATMNNSSPVGEVSANGSDQRHGDETKPEIDTWKNASYQTQQRCRFRRRYESCHRNYMNKIGRGKGETRRKINDFHGGRQDLPHSWSQQVSDIMNPSNVSSMIFY